MIEDGLRVGYSRPARWGGRRVAAETEPTLVPVRSLAEAVR
ncbi:hypothetical protein [Haloterrigena turkmenica]|nr:hypothetical protein [Haloterrigena turkmenica]